MAVNQEYVDGGLTSPVPVRVARAMGADIVIAVDVSYSAQTRLADGGAAESGRPSSRHALFAEPLGAADEHLFVRVPGEPALAQGAGEDVEQLAIHWVPRSRPAGRSTLAPAPAGAGRPARVVARVAGPAEDRAAARCTGAACPHARLADR